MIASHAPWRTMHAGSATEPTGAEANAPNKESVLSCAVASIRQPRSDHLPESAAGLQRAAVGTSDPPESGSTPSGSTLRTVQSLSSKTRCKPGPGYAPPRWKRSACGWYPEISSSGKMGRWQTTCPSDRRLALVAPGASTLTSRPHQSANICGSQCGDLTTTRSKCSGF